MNQYEPPDTARPYVAAFVIFRDKDGKVAFLLRENTKWMNGHYGLPAGKVEHQESIEAAAIREAKEEVGVDIKPENLKHVLSVYRIAHGEDIGTWLDVLFEATEWEGELINAEPHVHSELAWFHPDALPGNTTPYIPFFFKHIESGNRYAEYGWSDTDRLK